MDGKTEQKLNKYCGRREINDKLTSYLSGHLTRTEELAVEDHLKRCKTCQHDLKFLRMAMKVQDEDFASAALVFLRSRS